MKPILCELPTKVLEILHGLFTGDISLDDNEKIVIEVDDDDDLPFSDDECPHSGDCEDCPYEEKCAEDTDDSYDFDKWDIEYSGDVPDMWGIPEINRVVFSGPATVVFWEDGTKTVVKCMEGEKFERYAGFAAACMKKMFGSTSRAKSVMEYFTVEQPKVEKKRKKEDEPLPGQMSIEDVFDPATATVNTMDNVIQEAINEALAK